MEKTRETREADVQASCCVANIQPDLPGWSLGIRLLHKYFIKFTIVHLTRCTGPLHVLDESSPCCPEGQSAPYACGFIRHIHTKKPAAPTTEGTPGRVGVKTQSVQPASCKRFVL